MAPVVPTYLVSDLVAQIRSESDLNKSQVLTDFQIAAIISDAGSALQDVFTGAQQHWNISTFDFTLAGGVNGNSVPLPVDCQQGHSVDVNPGTPQPYTLRYLSNWLDRNKMSGSPFVISALGGGPREYYFLGAPGAGGTLVVLPANSAAGNFRLYYTPFWVPLAVFGPLPGTTSPAITGFTGPAEIGFPTAAWTSAWVGQQIQISGASNPGNNGIFTIASIVSPNAITVSPATIVNEGSGASAAVQPIGTSLTLPTFMNSWVKYLKTKAIIAIRNKRGQDVESFMADLAMEQQRIDKIVGGARVEEPTQPPLTRGSGFGFGGAW